jgi:hypothetical protein
MRNHFIRISLLLIIVPLALSCEIDTKLRVTGGNPPDFEMTGNGNLTSIRVRGHKTQRNAFGEDALLYWVIESGGWGRDVGRIGSVTYGKVPDGYGQKYPESGAAPILDEGEHYYVRVTTSNANGDDGYFMIIGGKTVFAKYESELPEESKTR